MTTGPQQSPEGRPHGQVPPPPTDQPVGGDPGPAPYPGHQGPAYTGTGYPSPARGGSVDADDRTWMILAHLSAPIAAVVSLGWLSFLGPLLIWVLRKDSSPPVRQVAAGAFNFNVSFWLANIIAWIMFFTVILIPVAIVIWVIAWPVAAIYHILGAVRAARGQVQRYPFQLPILS